MSKRALDAELKQLEDGMDKQLNGLNEFEQDSFYSEVNDHWIETAETLPRLQWYSQLLVVYGYFEKLLNDLCHEQKAVCNLSLSLNDLHGQGIERARNYLVKAVGIDKTFAKPEWQAIKSIGVLRNSVAHKVGFVDYEPDLPKSTYSILSRVSGVELRQETLNQEDAQIVFNEQVIIGTLKLFDTFIRDLAAEIENGQENALQPDKFGE